MARQGVLPHLVKNVNVNGSRRDESFCWTINLPRIQSRLDGVSPYLVKKMSRCDSNRNQFSLRFGIARVWAIWYIWGGICNSGDNYL
jgi:hypothetical protein